MKKIIVLFICLVIAKSAMAQVTTYTEVITKSQIVDTSAYKISYLFKFPMVKAAKPNEDLRIVQIGKRMIKEYSQIGFTYDSTATAQHKRGATQIKGCPSQIFPYEIFTNYSTGKNLILYRAISNMGNYQYEEPTPQLKWELDSTAHTVVLGYHCNKATTTYAGRTYTAWYTLEIPLHAGPFKFAGLPGLILQVEDSEHKYYWEAKGIEKANAPIFYHTYLYPKLTKTTREKTREMMDKMFASPIMMYKFITGYPTMRQNPDGSWREAGKADDHPIDYERIEKE